VHKDRDALNKALGNLEAAQNLPQPTNYATDKDRDLRQPTNYATDKDRDALNKALRKLEAAPNLL
jgi:hypothetical protein